MNKPKFNITYLPLSGEYSNTNIINGEIEISNFEQPSVEKLLKSYNTTEPFSNSNMMQITNNFGKILFGETLDALVLIINLSKVDDMRIKEFRVVVTNKALQGQTLIFQKTEFLLFEAININVPAGKFFSQKVTFKADIMCKHQILADIQYSCNYFNNEYIKNSTGKIIKTKNDNYFIEAPKGNVIKKYHKKMMFDNNLLFKIREKVISSNLEKGFVEFNIINQSAFTLRLVDLNISYNLLSYYQNTEETMMNKLLPIRQFKEMNLESEEEYSLLYYIDTYSDFLKIDTFIFKLSWIHLFDSIPILLTFNIKNKILNDLFTMIIYSKPDNDEVKEGDICQIKFIIQNIHKNEIFLKVSTELSSVKELDVIDIIPRVSLSYIIFFIFSS